MGCAIQASIVLDCRVCHGRPRGRTIRPNRLVSCKCHFRHRLFPLPAVFHNCAYSRPHTILRGEAAIDKTNSQQAAEYPISKQSLMCASLDLITLSKAGLRIERKMKIHLSFGPCSAASGWSVSAENFMWSVAKSSGMCAADIWTAKPTK